MNPLKRLALFLALACLVFRAHAATILVEAESFKTPGGWVLDTQFIETMDSPYLMAHGPESAVSTVTVG